MYIGAVFAKADVSIVRFSRRFAEAVSEERQARYFRLFATREEARAWLATPA